MHCGSAGISRWPDTAAHGAVRFPEARSCPPVAPPETVCRPVSASGSTARRQRSRKIADGPFPRSRYSNSLTRDLQTTSCGSIASVWATPCTTSRSFLHLAARERGLRRSSLLGNCTPRAPQSANGPFVLLHRQSKRCLLSCRAPERPLVRMAGFGFAARFAAQVHDPGAIIRNPKANRLECQYRIGFTTQLHADC